MGLGVSLDTDGSLRLLNLKLGCKVARMQCFDDRLQNLGEDVELGPMPNQEETAKLILSTASGFCIIAMGDMDQTMASTAPAEAGACMEAEEPEEGERDGIEAGGSAQDFHSWLVFFEQGQMLRKLFPPLAEKAGDKGNVTKLFSALTKEEFTKLQPQAVPSTFEKAQILSEKVPPPNPAAIRAAKLAAEAAKAAESSTRRGRKSRLETPNTLIAKLTQENLRKFAQAQQAEKAAQGIAKAASSFGSGGFKSATIQTQSAGKEEVLAPHGVPKNWQVSVKSQMKKALAGKESRQTRMAKRMDQLMKEVGG